MQIYKFSLVCITNKSFTYRLRKQLLRADNKMCCKHCTLALENRVGKKISRSYKIHPAKWSIAYDAACEYNFSYIPNIEYCGDGILLYFSSPCGKIICCTANDSTAARSVGNGTRKTIFRARRKTGHSSCANLPMCGVCPNPTVFQVNLLVGCPKM